MNLDFLNRFTSPYPASWPAFARDVRGTQDKLLNRLDEFPDAILITGCQRSGGTMLSRLITGSEGMEKFWFSKDEELDAALILSGAVPHTPKGRYCFQTTYLNERWPEYLEHAGKFTMIWSLRNPYSVIYSMVYNWKRFALDELFLTCGYAHMDYVDRVRFQRFGIRGVAPIRRAAYAFVGKVGQLPELHRLLPEGSLHILEYDRLVKGKNDLLPQLYERIRLAYKPEYGEPISERSLGKKSRLTGEEQAVVDRICGETYERALGLVNLG